MEITITLDPGEITGMEIVQATRIVIMGMIIATELIPIVTIEIKGGVSPGNHVQKRGICQ